MNQIVRTTEVLAMTSREIAELTGKEHKHVLTDIRNMLEQLGMHSAGFSAQYKDSTGRMLPCFNLPKDLTITLISGYNVTMRHRIVTRWQELEAKSAAPLIPQSLPEALRLAADLADQKAKAEAALALAAPKAMALDLLETGSDGSFCLTDAAKHLKVPPRKFSARLQQMGWIYRRPMGTGWLAYQARLAAGVMEHKVSTGDKSDGSGWSSTQVRVTAKGMAKLALIFVQEGEEVMCT